MRSRWAPLGAALVAGLLIALGSGTSRAAEEGTPEELQEKRKELKRLESAAEEISKRLERTRERREGIRSSIYKLEERISTLREERRQNRQALERTRSRLDELGQRRQRLQERLAEQRRQLAGYLEAAYRSGRHGFLRQLFGHEDPTALRRAFTYLGHLHRFRRQQVARLRENRERLGEVVAKLKKRRAQAQELEARLADQEERLEERKADRRSLLEELAGRARQQEERLSSIRADQKELRRVLERLREAGVLVDIEDKRMAELKGELSLPVADPDILARFGSSREGRSTQWQGVLLGAEAGSEVRAIFHGRVAYADHLRGYGLLIILDHGDGLLSLYAHNRALFKEVGEWVETGDTVAEVGRSGGRQRSATYFEIRREGEPVNPSKWCRIPQAPKSRARPPSQGPHLWALR